ncbi:MAG: biotin--[acetyl-CoA-carboxylase] ligase [Candidatus Omnitrophota bacterium]
MAKDVLDFLKAQDGFVSGEEISRSLKISRTAVWKYIERLRAEGYLIEAVPHLGYRIISIPDKLLPEEISYQLNTKIIGQRLFYYETLGSTMDAAFELGLAGFPEGTAVFAESQTKGRGRLGRSWFSPKGKGIYLSLLLRPEFLPQGAPKITLMTAVSISEAIKKVTGLSVLIKWPNDIVVGGKKLAGILTELNAEADKIKFVNIGIGINVNSSKSFLPLDATSLKEEIGTEVSRIELAKEVLRAIENNYFLLKEKGFKPILEKCKASSAILGKRIEINSQNRVICGEAQDIDMDGALLVRQDTGFIERVLSGDVVRIY